MSKYMTWFSASYSPDTAYLFSTEEPGTRQPSTSRRFLLLHTREPCILDEDGIVKDCVWKARERGFWFDLSHGSNNFTFNVAEKAMAQGFVVVTISTDLHSANILGTVKSMPETMSKILYLGMPLETIINKVTEQPIKMLGLKDKTLGIKIGKRADLTAFLVESGCFTLTDSAKVSVTTDKRISKVATVLGDNLYLPRKTVFLK